MHYRHSVQEDFNVQKIQLASSVSRIMMLAAVVVAIAGCSSSAQQADLIDPTITIRDLDARLPPNQMSSAPIDVSIVVEIRNRSSETFVLKRLAVQSVGGSAFRVSNETKQFTETIASGENKAVQMWIRAYANANAFSSPTLPLVLRGSATFDTPLGQKRSVFVEQMTLANTLR
jgi:hypothetical protein